MTRVPTDECVRHAAEYLEEAEAASVERNGQVIGRYVPAPNDRSSAEAPQMPIVDAPELDWSKIDPESRAIMVRLQATLQRVYAETGLTEDEFADLLDPSKPFPHDLDPK